MQDIEIEEFVRIIEIALSSKNPSIKKALKNLLTISAIVEAQELHNDNPVIFEKLLTKISNIEKDLQIIKSLLSIPTTNSTHYPHNTWINNGSLNNFAKKYVERTRKND